MKRLLIAGVALALLVPAFALAESVFDGSWKLEPATLQVTGGQHAVVSLKDGVYACRHCGATDFKVKADGKDHAVAGNPDYDTIAIEVLNDHAVRETDKKDGKVVAMSTATASADGNSLAIDFTDHSGPQPASGTLVVTRLGKATAGANAVVGEWAFGHYESLSDPSGTMMLKVTGNQITLRDAAGSRSATAEIGGPAVAFTRNGKADGTIAVQRLARNSLRMTFAKHGKVTGTTTITVAADGKSLKMTSHNPKTGATSTMIHRKV